MDVQLASAAATFALTASFLLAGCDAQAPATAPDPRPSSSAAGTPSSSEAAYDGPAIEPGTYTRKVSVKDVKALGQDPSMLPDLLGPDGKGLVVYKFEGSAWTEFHGPDDDQLERGSFGSHRYDENGHLVLSEPCCGESVLVWNSDGSTLHMKLQNGATEPTPIDHLMRDGVYTKGK